MAPSIDPSRVDASWPEATIPESLAGVSSFLRVSPAVLLLGVLPHAFPELIALFLPLAAWIIASRRGEWEQLLAATFVTLRFGSPTTRMVRMFSFVFSSLATRDKGAVGIVKRRGFCGSA